MPASTMFEAIQTKRSLTSLGSERRCSAAGVMTSAIDSAERMMATRCTSCSGCESFSPKPWLNTAISWKPNSAWMPGSTMRHSSSRCEAAESSEIACFLPLPAGLGRDTAFVLASRGRRCLVRLAQGAESDRVAQAARGRDAVLPLPACRALHLVRGARRELQHQRLVLGGRVPAQAHARPPAERYAGDAPI